MSQCPDVVYLDHAASAWPQLYFPDQTACYANPSSDHILGTIAATKLQTYTTDVSTLLGANDDHTIIFTSGGTESNNTALRSEAWDFIVTTQVEHVAVYNTAHVVALEQGGEIVILDVDGTGLISLTQLSKVLSDRRSKTGIVSIAYVNGEIGTVQDLETIGSIIVRENEQRRSEGLSSLIKFHTDAVQAPGHVRCDIVDRWRIDFLSLSAHKFHGPAGVGVLYCRTTTTQAFQPLLHGGGQQRGHRSGTVPVALIGAMTEALGHATRHYQRTQGMDMGKKMDALRRVLIPHIVSGDVILTGHPTQRAPHHMSFCLRQKPRQALIQLLRAEGVLCSGTSACSGSTPLAPRVLLAIGIPDSFTGGSVRMSVSHTNSDAEITRAIGALQRALRSVLSQ